MGRCGGCQGQTQRFCFVHQEFVCDTCLVDDESKIHARCVVNTYRTWVQDNGYKWPPSCSICSRELGAGEDIVRRACLDLEHVSCLGKSDPPDYPCGACQMPLKKSLDSSEIGMAIQKRIIADPRLSAIKALVLEPHTALPSPQILVATRQQISSAAPLSPDTVTNVPPGVEALTNRNPLQKENSTLPLTRIDPAQKSSQVSQEFKSGSKQHISDMSSGRTGDGLRRASSETRLNVGYPNHADQESPQRPTLPALKTNRNRTQNGNSTSMRKALKAGNRRWIDVRKLLLANKREAAVAVLFVICVCILAFLMSGEDDEMPVAAKPVVEEMSLPNVRINPLLKGRKVYRGKSLGKKYGRVLRRRAKD